MLIYVVFNHQTPAFDNKAAFVITKGGAKLMYLSPAGRTAERTTDGHICVSTPVGWPDGRTTDGRTDGRTDDGWTDGRTDGRNCVFAIHIQKRRKKSFSVKISVDGDGLKRVFGKFQACSSLV